MSTPNRERARRRRRREKVLDAAAAERARDRNELRRACKAEKILRSAARTFRYSVEIDGLKHPFGSLDLTSLGPWGPKIRP